MIALRLEVVPPVRHEPLAPTGDAMPNSHLSMIATPHAQRLSDECQLSFAAAASCFVLGSFGMTASTLAPGSTQLGALLVVALFYLLLGLAGLRRDSLSSSCPHNPRFFRQGPKIASLKRNGSPALIRTRDEAVSARRCVTRT